MSSIKKAILIGFGVLEERNGRLYGKNQVIRYAEELSDHFDEVILIANIENKNNFRTELKKDNIRPITTKFTNFFSIKALKGLLSHYREVIKLTDKRTGIIINSPNLAYTLIIPILYFRSSHLSGYIMTDIDDLKKIYRSEPFIKRTIKHLLLKVNDLFLIHFSHSLFLRCDPRRYQRKHSRAYVSKPIISLKKKEGTASNRKGSENGYRILYVGGLYKNKGVDVLIHSFDNVSKNMKDIELSIVGDGAEKVKLIDITNKLHLGKKVHFHGYIDDPEELGDIYRSSDVLVLPSLYTEGMPRVFDEAHHYGVPIIASRLKYGENIIDGENILLFEPGNADHLSKSMMHLIEDDKIRNKLIRNGLKRIKKDFGESAAKQHSRIIKG